MMLYHKFWFYLHYLHLWGQWSNISSVKESATYPPRWWVSCLWPACFSYGAPPLRWRNLAGDGELVLRAPRPTSFIRCVFLALRSPAGACGRQEVNWWSRGSAPLLVMAVGTTVLSFPATSSQLCSDEEGRCLFPEGSCFCLLHASPQCEAAARLLWCAPKCVCNQRLCPSPKPASLLVPICPPSDVWMCGSSGVFVCWAGGPLWSYSYSTCKVKGGNSGVFSLCHDAYVTLPCL